MAYLHEDQCWYCEPCAARCPTSAGTVSAPTPSGWLAMADEFGQADRGGLRRDLNPSWVPLTRDADTYQRVEGMLVDPLIALTYHGPVDIPGDDQGQRIDGQTQRPLHAGGVEQTKRDVERLAEHSPFVVVDLARVHDYADPELALRADGTRQAGVVVGQEPGELGHYPAQQYRLGYLVDRMDEDKEPVTAIDERVIVTRPDSR
jgi:ferredoxin